MPASKTRPCRPRLDRLESIRLMTAGLHRPAMVHQLDATDLSQTQVARDVLAAVAHSTVKFARGKIALTALSADSSAGTIRGGVTVKYTFGFLEKVTSNVVFQTSLDSPNPKDVKIYLSSFNSFLSTKDRTKVQTAVARVLVADHDKIEAALTS